MGQTSRCPRHKVNVYPFHIPKVPNQHLQRLKYWFIWNKSRKILFEIFNRYSMWIPPKEVPVEGIEPPLPLRKRILNPSRLPIPPHRHCDTKIILLARLLHLGKHRSPRYAQKLRFWQYQRTYLTNLTGRLGIVVLVLPMKSLSVGMFLREI